MVPDHADPSRGLIVREVSLRDFRSYAKLDLELEPGVVLVSGPNGAGKTNLLEALHLGTQGFSPRARSDAQMIRFDAPAARVRLDGRNEGRPFEADVVLRASESRRARLNGDTLRSAEQLRQTFRTLVFTPDRLAVVKGGPAVRRAYLDRALGRLFPGRSALPAEYAAAVSQRNEALRRIARNVSSLAALEPWNEAVSSLGAQLVESRRATVEQLAAPFAAHAELLGLSSARLEYEGEPPSLADYERRLEKDLERGLTGAGPHLHDVRLEAGDRELRTYGSQGEQRTAVLALVLAEADVLAEGAGRSPLLLLDDVLSELDGERRRALAEVVSGRGQTIVTAAAAAAFPFEPAQSLAISRGEVRRL